MHLLKLMKSLISIIDWTFRSSYFMKLYTKLWSDRVHNGELTISVYGFMGKASKISPLCKSQSKQKHEITLWRSHVLIKSLLGLVILNTQRPLSATFEFFSPSQVLENGSIFKMATSQLITIMKSWSIDDLCAMCVTL